jgi:hypothetical protein
MCGQRQVEDCGIPWLFVGIARAVGMYVPGTVRRRESSRDLSV